MYFLFYVVSEIVTQTFLKWLLRNQIPSAFTLQRREALLLSLCVWKAFNSRCVGRRSCWKKAGKQLFPCTHTRHVVTLTRGPRLFTIPRGCIWSLASLLLQDTASLSTPQSLPDEKRGSDTNLGLTPSQGHPTLPPFLGASPAEALSPSRQKRAKKARES